MAGDGFQIAELNYGRMWGEADDPVVAEFIAAIARVYAVAERSPGFVWRQTEGPGTSYDDNGVDPDDRRLSVNLSVWADVAALRNYVNRTVHRAFLDRRDLWFEHVDMSAFIMWRVPVGHRPTVAEGLERLAYRKVHGDTDRAFGWSYADAHGL